MSARLRSLIRFSSYFRVSSCINIRQASIRTLSTLDASSERHQETVVKPNSEISNRSRADAEALHSASRVLVSTEPTFAEKFKAASASGKVKLLWKRYGVIFVATYFTLYGATIGSLFLTLDTGLLSASTMGMDTVEIVHKLSDFVENTTGITWLPNYFREHPRLGTLAVAWMGNKMTEPVRIAATVVLVPRIGSYIQQRRMERRQRDARLQLQYDRQGELQQEQQVQKQQQREKVGRKSAA